MDRREFNDADRRLIEANTVLVDKNKMMMEDLKKLSSYILRPTNANREAIIELAGYYDGFTYYREEMDKYAPQEKKDRSSDN